MTYSINWLKVIEWNSQNMPILKCNLKKKKLFSIKVVNSYTILKFINFFFMFRYNIMLDCWKMNPMTRPSFTDLAERLGDLLQDGTKSVSYK